MWPLRATAVGLATTICPPTVSSAAGTPSQYQVVEMGVRCEAYGLLAYGAMAKRVAVVAEVCCPARMLARKPTMIAAGTRIRRRFMSSPRSARRRDLVAPVDGTGRRRTRRRRHDRQRVPARPDPVL